MRATIGIFGVGLLLGSAAALAAPDPATEIEGVYAWMSPGGALVNLVMDVYSGAPASARFSDSVEYVFHTRSMASSSSTSSVEEDVICTFDAQQKVSCWAGDSFVAGDASGTAGIESPDGLLRVFAGRRDDPEFWNRTGFDRMTSDIAQTKLTFATDSAGCPRFDAVTQAELVREVGSGANGGPARDDFAAKNVLALVVQVDKGILTRGGSFVAIYGAIHEKP